MKYIMFEVKLPNSDDVEMLPIIFPKTIAHSTVNNFVPKIIRYEDVDKNGTNGYRTVTNGYRIVTAVSAGFVNIMSGQPITCFGKSESMALESRPEDAAIISLIDYKPFK